MTKMLIAPMEGHEFQFTRNWFHDRNRSSFRDYILPFWVEKPCIYLEIGVFEGMSLVWTLQHVLTHPESRAIGIDPWLMTVKFSEEDMEKTKSRAFHNLSPWMIPTTSVRGGHMKCRLIRGNSAEVLRKMRRRRWGFEGIQKNSVDLCMIDGNHNELGVLDDARVSFDLLKVGGWMCFDDVENDKRKFEHVRQGLHMFLQEENRVKLLWKDRHMEAYEKVEE